MQPEKAHYVYVHRRENDGTIFYVGKGRDRRAWSRAGRNPHWRHTVAKHGFTVEIVRRHMSERCAHTLERITISIIGKDRLANMVDGGGGIPGWKHSDEAKAKISAANLERGAHPNSIAALIANRRWDFPPSTRAKMSAAKKGIAKGPMSAATRAKISASHIGLKPSQQAINNMSAAKRGKFLGKESPSYDHTIRHFTHGDHGDFTGTRGDLIAKYGLGSPCMSALLKGKQKSVKGWRLK